MTKSKQPRKSFKASVEELYAQLREEGKSPLEAKTEVKAKLGDGTKSRDATILAYLPAEAKHIGKTVVDGKAASRALPVPESVTSPPPPIVQNMMTAVQNMMKPKKKSIVNLDDDVVVASMDVSKYWNPLFTARCRELKCRVTVKKGRVVEVTVDGSG